jgi:uncharacterized protein (TIGR03000 family)
MTTPGAPTTPEKPGVPEPVGVPKKSGQLSGPAKLIVSLPDNAKLYVDDQLMKTEASVRTFNTPALQQGQTYYYMLRAEVVREGQTYEETRRILIRAGDTVRAEFPELERTLAAAGSATISTAGANEEP